MLSKVVFQSDSREWGTPQYLFDSLNKQYGPFDLDAAATPLNAKCKNFYTKEDDALSQNWIGKVFLNPPYGKEERPCKSNCKKKKCEVRGYHITETIPGIKDFVIKAMSEVVYFDAERVVCLLPARTDQDWFHDYCIPYGYTTFIRRRIKFEGAPSGAPFPSMIVVFENEDYV